jgi:CxxC motif-containing protein (DUF1111 family)
LLRGSAGLLVIACALQSLGTGSCAKEPQPGDPLPGLEDAQLARFAAGRGVFEQVFTPEQGLGPLFNADACRTCHVDPVTGGVSDTLETQVTQPLAGGACDLLFDKGGPVFQAHATAALTAALGITSEPLPEGALTRATRSTPDLFGLGLLDAVPDATILAMADSADHDGDGISGRVNRFLDGRIGRFGRKAFVPSLDEFNAGAFGLEMGITNPGSPAEETIGGQPIPAGVDPTPEPELTQEGLAFALDFVKFLAPVAPLPLTPRAERGRSLFQRWGCASCHTPSLKTGTHPVAALDRKVVHAYTNLLLHDMGSERGDICVGLASPSEFRTEPLMGLRHMQRFLHDGRAATVTDAILAHGGEGARSRDAFAGLEEGEREMLLAFLGTL